MSQSESDDPVQVQFACVESRNLVKGGLILEGVFTLVPSAKTCGDLAHFFEDRTKD